GTCTRSIPPICNPN
nr:Chain I, Trypsin inhibitor 1 [Helianthus annuus]